MLNGAPQPKSYITRLRGVPMLPEERVAQVLSLQDGIVDEPPSDGRLLVATNLRIIYLQQDKDAGEASLLPVEELNGVVVNSRTRSSISWFQGILMVLTALLFYLVIAYWFAGRFDAPYLPVINMDLEVLIILAAIVIGGWFFWRQTSRRAGGLVTLRGSNWSLSIDYLGADKLQDVYTMANTLFLYRQSRIAIGQSGNESEATLSHLS